MELFWYYLGGIAMVYITAGISFVGMLPQKKVQMVGPRPPFQPPDWFFSVIWPILYTLEGIAIGPILYEEQLIIIGVFITQLIFSMMWTWVAVKWKHEILGLYVLYATIIGSVICEGMFIWEYYNVSAALFSPYIIWLFVAAILNGWYVYNDEEIIIADPGINPYERYQ